MYLPLVCILVYVEKMGTFVDLAFLVLVEVTGIQEKIFVPNEKYWSSGFSDLIKLKWPDFLAHAFFLFNLSKTENDNWRISAFQYGFCFTV